MTTNDFLLVTNVWAQRNEDRWCQISTTNWIPDVPAAQTPTNGILWWSHPYYEWGVPGNVATNARAFTNIYWHFLQADMSAGTIAALGTNIGFNTSSSRYSFAAGAVTGVVTTTLSWSRHAQRRDWALNVQDVWAWDLHNAMQERDAVQPIYGGAPLMEFSPGYFDDGELASVHWVDEVSRNNLVDFKAWLRAQDDPGMTWVNTTAAVSNRFDAYFSTHTNSSAFPMLTVTGVYWAANAPSNYDLYTPTFDLGGMGPGVGHVVTSSYSFRHVSGVATQSVLDYTGGVRLLVGTNGQTWTWASTNADVALGFTTSDYGYRPVTGIMRRIAWDWASASVVSNDYTYWYGTGATWQAAMANVDTSPPPQELLGETDFGTLGTYNGATYQAHARASRWWLGLTHPLGTNALHATDFYVTFRAPINVGLPALWNANSNTVAVQDRTVFVGSETGTNETVSISIGGPIDVIPVWCDEPTTSSWSILGYAIDTIQFNYRPRCVLRYDVPGGFRY